MGLAAGLLRWEIEIYRPVDIINETGEKETTFELKDTTRARKMYNSGNRSFENNEIVNNYQYSIQVRKYVDIKERDNVKMDGKMYRVITVEPVPLDSYKEITIELINE